MVFLSKVGLVIHECSFLIFKSNAKPFVLIKKIGMYRLSAPSALQLVISECKY